MTLPFSFTDRMLFVLNTLSLAHGILSVDDDGVGIVDDPVKDRVSECTFSDFSVPAFGRKL
jgi:hypothetical protein